MTWCVLPCFSSDRSCDELVSLASARAGQLFSVLDSREVDHEVSNLVVSL